MRIHHCIGGVVRIGILLVSAIAHAQSGAKPAGSFMPDLSFTYSKVFANAGPAQCGCFRLDGGTVELAMSSTQRWAAVVELGGETTSSVNQSAKGLSLITFTTGARFTPTAGRNRLFAHVLAGGVRGFNSYFPNSANSSAATGFALVAGGGLNLDVSRTVALRVVQVDYLLTVLPNSINNHQNNIRVSAGIAFHLPSGYPVH